MYLQYKQTSVLLVQLTEKWKIDKTKKADSNQIWNNYLAYNDNKETTNERY